MIITKKPTNIPSWMRETFTSRIKQNIALCAVEDCMHHRIVPSPGSGTCAEVSRRMIEPKPAIMRRGRQLSRVTCHEAHKRDTGPGAGHAACRLLFSAARFSAIFWSGSGTLNYRYCD